MSAYSFGRGAFTAAFLSGLIFVAAASAGTDTKRFDIAAQSAATALNEFAKQADITLVFSYQLVSGMQTNQVKGDLSVSDALARMLEGTKLSYRQVGKNTVAINAREAGTPTSTSTQKTTWQTDKEAFPQLHLARVDSPAAPAAQERPAATTDKKKDSATVVEVTGSRIRSVLGEATARPVYVYTSEDLEKMGVQQITDLNNYIPQLPTLAWESTPETGFVNLANQGGRVNFNGGLRNLGDTATLLLINGRRAPKLGAADGADSYDLSGIPISSVERIEILTDGASAVYGADAAAGVVNVILKKDYTGTQFSAIYGNTFESDTGYTNLQLSTSYNKERFGANLSVNWSHTNAFSPYDRWFSRSADRRPFGALNDGRGTIPDGPGVIRNPVAANLPGLNVREISIPNGSDGVNLTLASFANAGPRAAPFDSPKYTVYGDKDMQGARLNLEYEVTSWMTAFTEIAHNEQSTYRPATPRTISVTVPAGYQGNPFGIPINVQKVYWDMNPYFDTTVETVNDSLLVGVRGPLPSGWRYEGGLQKQETDYSASGLGATTTFGGTTAVQAAINNVNPALRPIILNDGTTVQPNSDAVMRAMLVDRSYGEAPESRMADFRVDGPIWKLPAGQISMALGTEYREEGALFIVPPNNDLGRLTSAQSRYSLGLFAEAQIPLVSPEQSIPLVNRLGVNLSARRDEYSDFDGKLVPRYSMLYHPLEWLALRASYGNGYKVPNLSAIYAPRTVGTVSIGSAANVFDPMRGGENIFANVIPPGTGYSVTQISGGNLDLKPELSRTINLGVLVDVPFISGLSFGVDYYDIEQTDRLGGGLVDIIANFEERITRAPPSAADIARGYAGLITAVDVSSINIATYQVKGVDYQARYSHLVGEDTTLDMRLTVTKPKSGETISAPNRPAVPNTPGSSYYRGTLMMSMRRGPMSIGTTTAYTSSYLGRYFPGGFYFNSRFLNAPLMLIDMNGSYDFKTAGVNYSGWLGWLTKDLRFSMNIYNVLNKEPPINPAGFSPVFTVDPRGRRYQMQFQKSF